MRQVLGEQPENELLQRLFRDADSNVTQALTAFFVSQPPPPPPPPPPAAATTAATAVATAVATAASAAAAAAAADAPPTPPMRRRRPPTPEHGLHHLSVPRPGGGEEGEEGEGGEGGGEEKGSGTFNLTLPQAEPPSPQPPPLPTHFGSSLQALAAEAVEAVEAAEAAEGAEGGGGSGPLRSPHASPLPFISEIIPERAKRLVLEMTSSEEAKE